MNDNDLIMYAYSNKSEGATLVADALGIKKMLHEGSNWVPRFGRTILNWGSGLFPRESMFRARVINHPEAVMKIIDKRIFFDTIGGSRSKSLPRVPSFTFSEKTAKGWVDDGETVVARQTLQGARGEGIVIIQKAIDFVPAPLYTKYIDKDYEFRVHVIGGKVVCYQQKIIDNEREVTNRFVRNYDNGFILVNRISPIPQGFKADLDEQAIRAVKFFGLDFGAVDVVVKDGLTYVLEINSAPYMNKYTTAAYVEAFQEMVANAA